jgi:hypothetical protein
MLRCVPGDYESPEDAKFMFEKHRGGSASCLIGDVDPHTERPTFVLYGEAPAGRKVQWKRMQLKPLG